MNPFALPTSGQSADWLVFAGLLLAMGIPVFCFALWLLLFRQPGKKHHKHRKRRHHRRPNPTLAQTGGLPPVRDPNQPPRGV